jgi:tetratricopeptide (TPR) repeat protein
MARLNHGTIGMIIQAAFAALMTASIVVIAGCGGQEKAVILGTEPLDRVSKVEDELIALETWVESKQKADILVHIDAIDDIEIVPPDLEESMKNAADHLKHGNTDVIYDIASFLEMSGTLGLGARAGLYDRVVWIFPSRRSIADLGVDAIRNFLIRARGYRQSDLSDLAINGKWIEGTLGGVPVTITNIEDFDPGEATAIVDIDLSYFSGMQAQNPEYRIGTASLLDFLRTMKEKGLGARLVTVTLSGKRRAVPVSIRYMGDIIVESLREPEVLVFEPEKWKTMSDAEGFLAEERFLEADSLYGRLVEEYPNDAGLQYMRGATLALLGWGRDCAAHLTRAYRIDELYLAGFFQVANFVATRGQVEVAESIASESILEEAFRRSELNYKMGIMYITAGRPEKALPFLTSVAKLEGSNVDLALMIFRTARDAGAEAEMTSSLETLVQIDRNLVRDRMPWVYRELGKLYENRGESGRAEKMYSLYIEAAPEDSAAVELKKELGMKKPLH